MIAPMDQITVVGRRSVAQDLLVSLQSLGVVQVDPLEPSEALPLSRYHLSAEDRDKKEGWDRAVARSAALLDSLEAGAVSPASRSDAPNQLPEITAQLQSVGKQVDALIAERGELRDELEVAQAYLPLLRDLAPMLAQLEGSRYLSGLAFGVAPDKLEPALTQLAAELEDRVVFGSRPRARDVLVVAAVLKRDAPALRAALSRAGLAELALPEQYGSLGVAKAAHVMEERSQALPKRLAAIRAELTKLSQQHAAKLAAFNVVARNHQSRFSRLEDMAEGRYGFALRGWVPSQDSSRVVDGLRKQFGEDVVVETRHADEHHDVSVPVKLDNPAWVKPFEGLLSLFAPPKYGNFDPSWTLAVFFPFFFGMIVGDIGFGLMFLALGLWLRSRGKAGRALGLGPLGITIPAGALPTIGTVINWCAVWTMVWGFLYGEFFGNLLERFPVNNPIFYPTYSDHYHGIIPIAIFRVHESGFGIVLLLSIAFGVLQVLGGWAIRAYYGFKHHDRKHLWEGVGMFAGLSALILFTYGFLTESTTPLMTGLVLAGLLVFVVSVFLSGVVLMPIELISNAGNILSYLRIFAVGLSAALIANLVTDLGYALGGVLPVIGPILGIVVAFCIHLLALLLKIISYTLQPLRLQYVEFFTKFGFYEESGRPYNPFRLLGGKA